MTKTTPTPTFPSLSAPKPEIADRGTVRLGSGCITATFPPLRRPQLNPQTPPTPLD